MPWPCEDVFDLLQVGQLFKAAQIEEIGCGGGKEGGVRHGTDRRHVTQQFDVCGSGAEVVVAQHGRHRLTTELPITCGVNVFVHTAAGNIGRILKVIEQVFFADMQYFKLDVLAEVRAVDKKFEAAP